ncbi:hypothetical protein MRX96_022010 [Rhipicephalus microplus]
MVMAKALLEQPSTCQWVLANSAVPDPDLFDAEDGRPSGGTRSVKCRGCSNGGAICIPSLQGSPPLPRLPYSFIL